MRKGRIIILIGTKKTVRFDSMRQASRMLKISTRKLDKVIEEGTSIIWNGREYYVDES